MHRVLPGVAHNDNQDYSKGARLSISQGYDLEAFCNDLKCLKAMILEHWNDIVCLDSTIELGTAENRRSRPHCTKQCENASESV